MATLEELYKSLDTLKELKLKTSEIEAKIKDAEAEIINKEIIPTIQEITDILLQHLRCDICITIVHRPTQKNKITVSDLIDDSFIQDHPADEKFISNFQDIEHSKDNTHNNSLDNLPACHSFLEDFHDVKSITLTENDFVTFPSLNQNLVGCTINGYLIEDFIPSTHVGNSATPAYVVIDGKKLHRHQLSKLLFGRIVHTNMNRSKS